MNVEIQSEAQNIDLGKTIHLLLEDIQGEGAQKKRAAILENVTAEMRSAYRSHLAGETALKQVLVNGTISDLETVADGLRHSVYFDVPDQKIPAWADLKTSEREEYLGQATAFLANFVVLNPLEIPETDGE